MSHFRGFRKCSGRKGKHLDQQQMSLYCTGSLDLEKGLR